VNVFVHNLVSGVLNGQILMQRYVEKHEAENFVRFRSIRVTNVHELVKSFILLVFIDMISCLQ
jgi:hypothetical protein